MIKAYFENNAINVKAFARTHNISYDILHTFNIATKDGNFNMQEFATAIQKSVFDALRKQEQNKINTTIYG